MGKKLSLNEQLIRKINKEQDSYFLWLRAQDSNTILSHAAEFALREEIVKAIRTGELDDDTAKALMVSPNTVQDILIECREAKGNKEKFRKGILSATKKYANEYVMGEWDFSDTPKAKEDVPVVYGSEWTAERNGIIPEFLASRELNKECCKYLDGIIGSDIGICRLGTDDIFRDAVVKYGVARVEYVLASTALANRTDERIPKKSVAWAEKKLLAKERGTDEPLLSSLSNLLMAEKLIEAAQNKEDYLVCHSAGDAGLPCIGKGWHECGNCPMYAEDNDEDND